MNPERSIKNIYSMKNDTKHFTMNNSTKRWQYGCAQYEHNLLRTG
jgi:hypothetical protein